MNGKESFKTTLFQAVYSPNHRIQRWHIWTCGNCQCRCGCGMPYCEAGGECYITRSTCEYYLWWQILHGTKKYIDGKWQ